MKIKRRYSKNIIWKRQRKKWSCIAIDYNKKLVVVEGLNIYKDI